MTSPGTSQHREPFGFARTLPGRIFILSSAILVVLIAIRIFVTLPDFLEVFRRVVRVAWVISLVWLIFVAVRQSSGKFLWRVRQKLILSYVFLGFVPVLLVIALALAGAMVLYLNVGAYMFLEGFSDISDSVQQVAETAAAEISLSPASAPATIARKYSAMSSRSPGLSLAVIPMSAKGTAPLLAGPWKHTSSPALAPIWLRESVAGFRGVIGIPPSANGGEWAMTIRSAFPTSDLSRLIVVDLPVDADVVATIEARTNIRMGGITVAAGCGGSETPNLVPPGGFFFKQTVAFMDCANWTTGQRDRMSVSLDAPIWPLYKQVVTRVAIPGGPWTFIFLLSFLLVVFLVIQGAALIFGALLARSITHAVHELFVGTERVQQGDFTHRINIDTGDQLGDLAGSFNRMSASIDHLLHVQREKQRLDDELRIARDIQKSLLPPSPPTVAGVSIADLCEPAREVGGDYYDFFELGPRQLGVMIADVSGKGTSAALYMAELKGLMLSLSQRVRSPRQLLIEANELLAAHLDNRSFITMTYLVLDLEARTLTCARAGHTPLVAVSRGKADVLIPSGMVLGLRFPGATERFGAILEEHTQPLHPGDVFVLYTDGITEAMDLEGELFSDESLARVVASQYHLDAAGIRERVVREVKSFVGEADQHDDMTMVVLKIDEREAA